MSGGLDAERWRLVELLQVRALRLFMAGPDARRLEWGPDGGRPMLRRYIPEHLRRRWREAYRQARRTVEEVLDKIRERRAMPPRYRRQLERLAREADARKAAGRDDD